MGADPQFTDSFLNIDLDRLDDVRAVRIPALLAQLAAASQQLAARLLSNGTQSATSEARGDRLLNAKEAARRCGLSPDWLYRHADTLPFVVRVGRSLRFSEAG